VMRSCSNLGRNDLGSEFKLLATDGVEIIEVSPSLRLRMTVSLGSYWGIF
jgi:hypothetical protein